MELAFWFCEFMGRLFAAIAILSLVTAFVRHQTRRNLLIASAISFVVVLLLSFNGSINGRLLSWFSIKNLAIKVFIPNIITCSIATILMFMCHWNTQKWFAKKLPWFAGIFYGLLLCLSLPMVIKEQFDIQNTAQELTLKQWGKFSNVSEQKTLGYKIIGMADAGVLSCLYGAYDSLAEDEDYLLKNASDVCRKLVLQNRK